MWRRALYTFLLLLMLGGTASAEPFSALAAGVIVLTLLGKIIVGAIVVGAAIGLSYLQAYLTRPKPSEGNKQDVRLTTAQEGAPIQRVYGTFAVAAKIIARGSVTASRIQVSASGKRTAANFETRYSCSLGAVVCENINGNIKGISRIWYNGNVLYEVDTAFLDGTNPGVYGEPIALNAPHMQHLGFAQAFQILLGHETQTDRCDWFATSGEDAEPAYRGYVTLWWRDMDLTPSYNVIPQILVEVVSSDNTIADVFSRECSLAGLTPAQITNNAPTDFPIGWYVDGPTPPKQTFEALSMWSPFAVAEVDGKLKSFPLPQSSSATVADGDLGAIEKGRDDQSDQPVKFALTADQPIEIPQRVEITFFNPNRAYEQSSAGYARQFGVATGVQQLFLPASTTKIGAQNVASQLLARMWTERDSIAVSLPPKYMAYHPGDTLTIPAPNGQALDLRIVTMEFAPGQRVNIEGIRQIRLQGLGYDPDEVSIEDPSPSDENNYIHSVNVISNCPPLVDDHDQFDGVYWAAGPSEVSTDTPPAIWMGATLYRNAAGSDDTYKDYEPMASTVTAAVIGKARTVLASATGIDTTNTVDIEFPYGLGTRTILGTLDQAFNATTTANLCILGKEVLQFRDVDDVSDLYSFPADSGHVYRLDHLKRGIRDTAGLVGTHAVNEAFVLWSPDSVIRVPVNINEHLGTYSYKTLTKGQEEAEISNPAFITVDPETPFTTLTVHVPPVV
jgi:hypothetical protein